MIHKCFKQAQDRYGIQGRELAKLAGIGPTHLSDFRSGKKWVSENVLVKLLEGMDKLAPGSRQYFCQLLTDEPINTKKQKIVQMIEGASDEEIEAAMIAIARKWNRDRLSSERKHDCSDVEAISSEEEMPLAV